MKDRQRSRKFEEIEALTEEALKDFPRNAWLLNLHGLAIMNMGRQEEAKSDFEIALNIANKMTARDWSDAYPGNDPRTGKLGLAEMRDTLRSNLALVSDN